MGVKVWLGDTLSITAENGTPVFRIRFAEPGAIIGVADAPRVVGG